MPSFKPEVKDIIYPKNCSATITEISVFGQMIISFNSSMFTHFNLSQIDSSVMDIFILPNFEYFEDPNYNATFHSLTWKVVDYSEREMKIKINFTKAAEVSAYA